MITAKLEQKGLDRYFRTLDKNRGKPLRDRAQRTINASAKRRLVPALKAAAPRGTQQRRARAGPIAIRKKRRKRMGPSAGSKLLRKRGGEDIRPTWVGYKAFHARLVIEGTQSHSLMTRGVMTGAVRGSAGRFGRVGRWTKPGASNFGTSNWRSAYAHFADDNVRPLAPIYVRGLTPNPVVDRTWEREQGAVLNDIRRDVFAVK